MGAVHAAHVPSAAAGRVAVAPTRRATAAAIVAAQARYWLTVAPRVRAQLRRWERSARAIRDPVLRAHALQKLREERGNTEAIATLCTLAPRRHRRAAVDAAVALQVMYDYLDAVTEDDPGDGTYRDRQLFRTFAVALTPSEAPLDYYRYHRRRDDSGYLDELVASARAAIARLPATIAVLPVARDVAERFGEAQLRSHAVPRRGVGPLERWAAERAARTGFAWWEWAAGAAASVLGLHALLSAAADVRTTRLQAVEIDYAYMLGSTLTTMLDSAVDDRRDRADGEHRYIAYYATPADAGRRVAAIARRAVAAARELPHPAHHAMTVAGIAAFYLSLPAARQRPARAVAARVVDELGPVVVPLLLIFRAWRWIDRRRG